MRPKTVLLVDYDPRSIAVIRRTLTSLGVMTILATDGEAGEREFHRAGPDLTLVQEIIPRRRGIDLCRALKSGGSTGHHPVILLSRARDGARARMLSARCDDIVETPFDHATLVAAVRKFLPDPASLPASPA